MANSKSSSRSRNGNGKNRTKNGNGNKNNGHKVSQAELRVPNAAAFDQADTGLSWFANFAHFASRWAGKPVTFLVCVALVLVWAASGPFFHFSDTWQLVINTSTTIITFLMVFLIQNTQNRDSLAFQIKLSELVIAMKGAPNSIASIEQLSDDELEKLQKHCHQHALETSERAQEYERALAGRRRSPKK
jgi:low affinity Fe/Cu permease